MLLFLQICKNMAAQADLQYFCGHQVSSHNNVWIFLVHVREKILNNFLSHMHKIKIKCMQSMTLDVHTKFL